MQLFSGDDNGQQGDLPLPPEPDKSPEPNNPPLRRWFPGDPTPDESVSFSRSLTTSVSERKSVVPDAFAFSEYVHELERDVPPVRIPVPRPNPIPDREPIPA